MPTGCFTISLDFELHWGVRDKETPWGPQRQAWLGAREAIPRMLDLFVEYGIEATWATVGFLFARDRDELRACFPSLLPTYSDSRLSPYEEHVGWDEEDDPIHYAPSLIERVRETPGQEIATHTFSHYYCLEAGQTLDQFAADLKSAAEIAQNRGIVYRSIVFPRNQCRPEYLEVVRKSGIECYRGTEASWMHHAAPGREKNSLWRKAARLADTYIPISGDNTTQWSGTSDPSGLVNIPSSGYLRPWTPATAPMEPIRMRRILGAMRLAAEKGRIFHIYWHPQDFGFFPNENLQVLRTILEAYRELREEFDFVSMNMASAMDYARASEQISGSLAFVRRGAASLPVALPLYVSQFQVPVAETLGLLGL